MIDLVLKKSKERSLLRRHPWVYDTAVQKVVLDSKKTAPASGETVRVVSFDGRFLAWAAYSPESTIRARCWSFKEEEVIDASWFERKLRHAVEARACLRDRTSAVRLVFGEADGLPGLIVDQYADCLVTQFQSAGVEAHRELIADLLMEITGVRVCRSAANCCAAKSRLPRLKSWKTACVMALTCASVTRPASMSTSVKAA